MPIQDGEAEGLIKLDRSGCRVHFNVPLVVTGNASPDRVGEQGAANPLPLKLRIDKQAAQIPEILDAGDANDLRTIYTFQMNHRIGILLISIQILRNVYKHISPFVLPSTRLVSTTQRINASSVAVSPC